MVAFRDIDPAASTIRQPFFFPHVHGSFRVVLIVLLIVEPLYLSYIEGCRLATVDFLWLMPWRARRTVPNQHFWTFRSRNRLAGAMNSFRLLSIRFRLIKLVESSLVYSRFEFFIIFFFKTKGNSHLRCFHTISSSILITESLKPSERSHLLADEYPFNIFPHHLCLEFSNYYSSSQESTLLLQRRKHQQSTTTATTTTTVRDYYQRKSLPWWKNWSWNHFLPLENQAFCLLVDADAAVHRHLIGFCLSSLLPEVCFLLPPPPPSQLLPSHTNTHTHGPKVLIDERTRPSRRFVITLTPLFLGLHRVPLLRTPFVVHNVRAMSSYQLLLLPSLVVVAAVVVVVVWSFTWIIFFRLNDRFVWRERAWCVR